MRFANRAGLTAGAVAAVIVLAGCGTSTGSLLTPGAATQLTSELNQASSALDAYNCQVAYTALVNFRDDVNQLTGVNATLVQILSQGASRISTLANERCPSGVSAATTTTSTRTSTTSTGTTTTGTTTSTSVTTTSPATTPTSATTPASGGAAPTTVSTPTVTPTPAPTVTTPAPATTPNSGGAGLNSSGNTGNTGNTGNGGTGVLGGGQ